MKGDIIKKKIIMIMTITIIIIITVLLLGSCKYLKENNKLRNAVFNNDLFYSEMLFFSTEVKGQVGYITIFNLRRNLLHDKKYDNCNLDSLLSEALKGNHYFNCNELEGCFEPSIFIEKIIKASHLSLF